MSEIKSTLDLVMEKTKHLSLSKDEKRQQKEREACQSLKGLIQQLYDQVITREMFNKRYNEFKTRQELHSHNLLQDQLLNFLALHQDNQLIFDLLQDICGLDPNPLINLFEEYDQSAQTLSIERRQAQKDQLLSTYQIAGSAVKPNVASDAVWIAGIKKLEKTFQDKLNQMKKQWAKTTCFFNL